MSGESEVRNDAERHRFEITLDDGEQAVALYRRRGDGVIEFYHTEVPPDHEGEGIGTRLIEAGLRFARERDLKVLPTCRFFKAYMDAHPDTAALRAQD